MSYEEEEDTCHMRRRRLRVRRRILILGQ